MKTSAKRKKLDDVLPDLPPQAQVGDRIQLKEDLIPAFRVACKLAGYSFEADKVYVVTREDNYAPGGGRRLFVEGPPHCFAAVQVKTAWNSDDERRLELRRRGWSV